MQSRQIFITGSDLNKLEDLLAAAGSGKYRHREDLKSLEAELLKAKVVEAHAIPRGVVTMNTRLLFHDLDDDSRMEVTLVFPADADIDAGKLSVLSPVGTALLGYAEGDTVEWEVPAGKRRIRIEKILYQPEAAGDFGA
jgi:regulator of nucleoside diphosphate kinase